MKHTPEEIKYRLSDLGIQIGNIAIEYIADLEEENAELKTKATALENANRAMIKELDDTTSGGLSVLENVVRNKEQLTKAKEIMNIAIEGIKNWGIVGGNERPFEKQAEMLFNLFLDKAEQFLKDSEVEK